jgi:hypothetical protein
VLKGSLEVIEFAPREVAEDAAEAVGLGLPLKFLWEKKAQGLTTYSSFWKQFYRKFPQ